jgi:hypothetical protein
VNTFAVNGWVGWDVRARRRSTETNSKTNMATLNVDTSKAVKASFKE